MDSEIRKLTAKAKEHSEDINAVIEEVQKR